MDDLEQLDKLLVDLGVAYYFDDVPERKELQQKIRDLFRSRG